MGSNLKGFIAALGTKTVWGAIAGAAVYVSQHDTSEPMTWINAIIGLFTVISARAAIGNPKQGSPPPSSN
jgi:hypothetical protein